MASSFYFRLKDQKLWDYLSNYYEKAYTQFENKLRQFDINDLLNKNYEFKIYMTRKNEKQEDALYFCSKDFDFLLATDGYTGTIVNGQKIFRSSDSKSIAQEEGVFRREETSVDML